MFKRSSFSLLLLPWFINGKKRLPVEDKDDV